MRPKVYVAHFDLHQEKAQLARFLNDFKIYSMEQSSKSHTYKSIQPKFKDLVFDSKKEPDKFRSWTKMLTAIVRNIESGRPLEEFLDNYLNRPTTSVSTVPHELLIDPRLQFDAEDDDESLRVGSPGKTLGSLDSMATESEIARGKAASNTTAAETDSGIDGDPSIVISGIEQSIADSDPVHMKALEEQRRAELASRPIIEYKQIDTQGISRTRSVALPIASYNGGRALSGSNCGSS